MQWPKEERYASAEAMDLRLRSEQTGEDMEDAKGCL
jgi:hypothetical protein